MQYTSMRRKNSMATASLACGIIAIICVVTVTYSVFFGCMGIVFACLSRGGGYKMPGRSVGGMVTSVLAIVVTIALVGLSMYLMVYLFGIDTVLDPVALQEALQEFYNTLLNELQSMGGAV